MTQLEVWKRCIKEGRNVSLEELRSLCAKYWNPIGVPMANTISEQQLGFRPLPVDEYDTHLAHVLTLIESGVSIQDIRIYLETVERDYLGMTSPGGSKDDFIRAVQAARSDQAER